MSSGQDLMYLWRRQWYHSSIAIGLKLLIWRHLPAGARVPAGGRQWDFVCEEGHRWAPMCLVFRTSTKQASCVLGVKGPAWESSPGLKEYAYQMVSVFLPQRLKGSLKKR